jgi:hypothetical protein
MAKIDTPGDAGPDRADLTGTRRDAVPSNGDRSTDTELGRLGTAFERSFEDTRVMDTEVFRGKLQEYINEIILAAQAAKAQYSKTFGGTQPDSSQFGVSLQYPGYFGWNDWDNLGNVSQGTFSWLDSDVPDNASGAANEPLTIGENAVHLVVGFGSYNPSPVTSAIRLRLNDKPRTRITTEQAFRETDLQIKWLDTPYLLKEDDDVLAEGYAAQEGQEALYPVTVSFLEEKPFRLINPAEMAGDTIQDYILKYNS